MTPYYRHHGKHLASKIWFPHEKEPTSPPPHPSKKKNKLSYRDNCIQWHHSIQIVWKNWKNVSFLKLFKLFNSITTTATSTSFSWRSILNFPSKINARYNDKCSSLKKNLQRLNHQIKKRKTYLLWYSRDNKCAAKSLSLEPLYPAWSFTPSWEWNILFSRKIRSQFYTTLFCTVSDQK